MSHQQREPLEGEPSPQEEKPAKRSFLYVYAVSLFAVAFVLVLLSYLGHENSRSRLESEQNQFSVSALQSLDSLRAENGELRDTVEALTAEVALYLEESSDRQVEIASLLAQLNELEARLSRQEAELSELSLRATALDALCQLEALYAAKAVADCRALAAAMREDGLAEALPAAFSAPWTEDTPRARFDKIAAAVGG